MAYWDYKIKEEFDKTYGYEDPLFRKKIKMVNYVQSFPTGRAGWTHAGIEDLKIKDESAIVDMKLKVKVVVSPSKNIEQDVLLKENWVKVEGIWYHVPQKSRARQSDDK